MRIAVLGQGSIGRRHAKNLVGLGFEVLAHDPCPVPDLAVSGVQMVDDPLQALASADIAIVATPSSDHLHHARIAIEQGCHVLVEKPLATSPEGIDDVAELARSRNQKLAVAMNLRFHPGPLKLKALLDAGAIGQPLRASFWVGFYLPAWRPDTDYRRTYSAQRALGGGILLDAVHELDYATWLLGPAAEVWARLATVSDLELDVEDVAHLNVLTEHGTHVAFTLDYLDRSYHRGCRIVGERGTLEWRWEDERVAHFPTSGPPSHHPAPSDVTPTYIAEIRDFLTAVRDERSVSVDAATAERVLALVAAARSSAAQGQLVRLSHRHGPLIPGLSAPKWSELG
jgi:predicted dehydrogenase